MSKFLDYTGLGHFKDKLDAVITPIKNTIDGTSWTDSRNAGGTAKALATSLSKGDIITAITGNITRIALMSDNAGTVINHVYKETDLPYTCTRSYTYWNAYNSSSTSETITMSVTRTNINARFDSIDAQISPINEDINGVELQATEENKVYKLTGSIGSSVPSSTTSVSGSDYLRKAVTPGDIIIVTGGVSSSYGGALAFIDSNDKILTVTKAGLTLSNFIVSVPDGAAEVIINKSHSDSNPIYFSQGTNGWKILSANLTGKGVTNECKFTTSNQFGFAPNPARKDASSSNSGYFAGYLVNLGGKYQEGYRYVYFKASNYSSSVTSSMIVRGIVLDSNNAIESTAGVSVAHSQGWQALPLTANSAQLWATYTTVANNGNTTWLPEYVIFQTTQKPIGEIIGTLTGATSKLESVDDDTPILPRIMHAVSGERVLIFKNAVIPGNYEKVVLSCTGGREFRRYLNFIPESTGEVTLNVKVNELSGTSTIKVVNPSNPSTQKNILIVGSSGVKNYATQFEELYRRLVLSTGDSNITEFGKSIRKPTNPLGLGLSNINFVGRLSNGEHFNYEATGGYTFSNYYGTATKYNYAFTVADTTQYTDGAIYTDGTYQFTINEISAGDNRVSMQCATQSVPLSASGTLSKVSGSGSSTFTYTAYTTTLTRPFLNPNNNETSLSYYMSTYCSGASVDIVYFHGLLFNSGFNWSYLEDYAKPLARVIHSEYPDAKMLFGTQALADTRGYGLGYTNKSSSALGQTRTINNSVREYVLRLEKMCDELNAEFDTEVCIVSPILYQCDSDYDYPVSDIAVDNRNVTTEPIGTNGQHPTTTGVLNQIDGIYRSICYVIASYFN